MRVLAEREVWSVAGMSHGCVGANGSFVGQSLTVMAAWSEFSFMRTGPARWLMWLSIRGIVPIFVAQ